MTRPDVPDIPDVPDQPAEARVPKKRSSSGEKSPSSRRRGASAEASASAALRRSLDAFADPGYAEFMRSGLPKEVDSPVIGVRIPIIKGVVKETETSGALEPTLRALLASGPTPSTSLEERIAVGYMLGRLRAPMSEKIGLLSDYMPWIDSWAVCDELCAFVKPKAGEKRELWDYVCVESESEAAYSVRFAIVMALKYYLDPTWSDASLELARRIAERGFEERHVRMGLAWLVAEAYAKTPDKGRRFLAAADCPFDAFTFKMAVMKILDSFRVDAELKTEAVELLKNRGIPSGPAEKHAEYMARRQASRREKMKKRGSERLD